MSTDYSLMYKLGYELDITEHSTLFDITLCEGREQSWAEISDLTLDEVKLINQRITNIISYFDPDYGGCKVDYEKQ
ncbi:MAG: hypothetical protein GY861_13140 [bacterium]|nr:hypothetical protein [bacterium]